MIHPLKIQHAAHYPPEALFGVGDQRASEWITELGEKCQHDPIRAFWSKYIFKTPAGA